MNEAPGLTQGRAPADLNRILAGQGDLTWPVWAKALLQVPRELFVPKRGWAVPDQDGVPAFSIDKRERPEQWFGAVYSDTSIVTQVDDGAGDPATGDGRFTSSVSAPGIVAQFGELLAPVRGDRILEVGTGSGWTASLLAGIVGEQGRVVSIEVDPSLAEPAAERVAAAGFRNVEVLAMDALDYTADKPFDRLHVTAGVADIPWSWMEALRPGGTAVMPWCPVWGHGHKLTLNRIGDEAVGKIHGSAGYMMLRAQRHAPCSPSSFLHDEDKARQYFTKINPKCVGRPENAPDWRTYGGGLVISAMAPGIRYELHEAEDGSGEATLWLHETFPGAREHGSWAVVEFVPDADEFEVTAYGERDLWEEVSSAWMYWNAVGRPDRTRFGATVSPEGLHVWLDRPSHVIG
ncbi:methyltransferase domain-containing protein [Actinomadura miaoliensis]|uniref:Protein-L-isoaspartate O-methyltransferase n=1 Tax=Actinomadura miaoliensis TaxID=430685 RepID=A0ABP7VTK1_9ACTN